MYFMLWAYKIHIYSPMKIQEICNNTLMTEQNQGCVE